MNTLTPSQQEIATRAYQLYLNSGCRHGSDWEHWFQAEKEVGAKFFTPPPAPAKSSEAKVPAVKAANAKAPDAKASPAAKKAAKKVTGKKAPVKKSAGK
jgi:hypothetical protein